MSIEIKTAAVLPISDSDEKERLKDWLLCGGRSRESDILEESNFDAIVKLLGGESDTVEIHRFGHWAVGWIEEILVHPSRRAEVEAIKQRLDDYPILDDDDHSTRENDAAFEAWEQYGCREFAEAMQNEFDLADSTCALLERSPDWTLYVFENNKPYALCTEGDRVIVKAYGGQTRITRDQMAACLRLIRKEIRSHG